MKLRPSLVLCLGLFAASALRCGGQAQSIATEGSETHLLRICASDADCGGVASCLCDTCTMPCSAGAQCAAQFGGTAESGGTAEASAWSCVTSSCGAGLVCEAECSGHSDCLALSPEHRCREGACRLERLSVESESAPASTGAVDSGVISSEGLDAGAGLGASSLEEGVVEGPATVAPIVRPPTVGPSSADAGAVDNRSEPPESDAGASVCIEPLALWTGDVDARESIEGLSGTFFGDATAGQPGRFGGAFNFDGVGDYIDVPDNDVLDFGVNDFTVQFWVRTTQSDGVRKILDKRVEAGSTVVGYTAYLYNGVVRFQAAEDNGGINICGGDASSSCTNYDGHANVADGQWHHVAITFDRDAESGALLYTDGVETGRDQSTKRPGSLSNASLLRFGRRSSSSTGDFAGQLDHIALIDRVLTPDEVAALAEGQELLCSE